jgi:hypothetical protein
MIKIYAHIAGTTTHMWINKDNISVMYKNRVNLVLFMNCGEKVIVSLKNVTKELEDLMR